MNFFLRTILMDSHSKISYIMQKNIPEQLTPKLMTGKITDNLAFDYYLDIAFSNKSYESAIVLINFYKLDFETFTHVIINCKDNMQHIVLKLFREYPFHVHTLKKNHFDIFNTINKLIVSEKIKHNASAF